MISQKTTHSEGTQPSPEQNPQNSPSLIECKNPSHKRRRKRIVQSITVYNLTLEKGETEELNHEVDQQTRIEDSKTVKTST